MWSLFLSYYSSLKNTKMSAQNFYEQMRKVGLTEDITSNESPDYNLSFYQSIFRLMEDFAKKELEEKLRWNFVYEKDPEYCEKLLIKCENGTYWIGYFLRHKNRSDAFYSYPEPDIEFILSDVIEWRYFL